MSLQLLYPQATEMVDDYIIYLSPLGGESFCKRIIIIIFYIKISNVTDVFHRNTNRLDLQSLLLKWLISTSY